MQNLEKPTQNWILQASQCVTGGSSPLAPTSSLQLGEESCFVVGFPQSGTGCSKDLWVINTALQLAEHQSFFALQHHRAPVALFCHMAKVKCDSQGFPASSTCTLLQGTRKRPCPNNVNRKLAISLAPQSAVHWQKFCLTITWEPVRVAVRVTVSAPHQASWIRAHLYDFCT